MSKLTRFDFRKTQQGIDLLSGSQTDIGGESNLQGQPSGVEYQVTSDFLAPGESRNDLSFDDEMTMEVSTQGMIHFIVVDFENKL